MKVRAGITCLNEQEKARKISHSALMHKVLRLCGLSTTLEEIPVIRWCYDCGIMSIQKS